MRWIAFLAFFFVLTGSALAAGADDQYLDIYNQISQADGMLQNGQSKAAAERYAQAQAALLKLQADHPDWNPTVVKFRLEYLSDKLASLAPFLPAPAATNVPPTNAPAPAPSPAPSSGAEPPSAVYLQQIAALQEQVRSLTDANSEALRKLKEARSLPPEAAAVYEKRIAALEGQVRTLTDANADAARKLKEALSVQPAGVSSGEMAKAQEKIVALQKERDLLQVALAQEKASHAPVHAPSPAPQPDQVDVNHWKDALANSEKKLAEANQELETLRKALPAAAPAPVAEGSKEIADERDRLKLEVAQLSKDLADSEAHQQAAPTVVTNTAQIEQLRAKLAVLEAPRIPYTAEELAVLKTAPSHPQTELPAAPAAPLNPTTSVQLQTHHVIHSIKDLPPGAGALMAEASRASMERDYGKAEQKYLAVLSQDENNVYVLAYLANAQYAAGHLQECEKTVQRALKLDPDDPAILFQLGVLRFRQDKLDQAFDALSRSALYNPTNAGTQNYLGCVLADKGLRPAAETALRKALQVDPDYADAHFNLALVYASEKPPSSELARWHYKRALELGHPKSEAMEKLLPEPK